VSGSCPKSTYRKVISKSATRRDRALRDPDGAVHMVSPVLEKPVEMQTGALIPKLVDYIDDDSVSNSGR
jgi:hypothetical protein